MKHILKALTVVCLVCAGVCMLVGGACIPTGSVILTPLFLVAGYSLCIIASTICLVLNIAGIEG